MKNNKLDILINKFISKTNIDNNNYKNINHSNNNFIKLYCIIINENKIDNIYTQDINYHNSDNLNIKLNEINNYYKNFSLYKIFTFEFIINNNKFKKLLDLNNNNADYYNDLFKMKIINFQIINNNLTIKKLNFESNKNNSVFFQDFNGIYMIYNKKNLIINTNYTNKTSKINKTNKSNKINKTKKIK